MTTCFQDNTATNRELRLYIVDDVETTMKKYWEGVTLERMEQALSERYLTEVGWRESAQIKMPVRDGKPIPWYTYSAIEFLKTIVCKDHNLFEFGAGCSTLFWESLVNNIVTVEHDSDYVNYVNSTSASRASVLFANSDEFDRPSPELLATSCGDIRISDQLATQIIGEGYATYATKILDYERDYFNFIVVDGVARSFCTLLAANHFSDGGIIVLDNSDRQDVECVISLLLAMGFRRIDFWGLGPVNPYGWCTSVFFRDNKTGEPIF